MPLRWLAAGIFAIACAGSTSLASAAEKSVLGKMTLKAADSWGYQLQNVRSRLVAKDKFDVLVVDSSRDGSEARAFSRLRTWRTS